MKYIISFLICLFSFTFSFSQVLSEKNKILLRNKVMSEYIENNVTGCSVYKTSNGPVLVSVIKIANNRNPEYCDRIAYMKATRSVIEFLRGARNRSYSTYNIENIESNFYTEDSNDDNNSDDSDIDAVTSVNMNENSHNSDNYTFTDEIVQTSMGEVCHLQMLKKVSAKNSDIYIYFIKLKK